MSDGLSMLRLPDWLEAVPHHDGHILRAILILDQMGRERGVRFYPQNDFALLRNIVDANRQHRANLSPMHMLKYCRLSSTNAFWIAGLDRSGRVVTTNSGKIFDWRSTHLEAEARSLRMFFDNPSLAPDGDFCQVDSPLARRISGHAFHSGTVWRHPEHRGELNDGVRLSQITGRLTRMVGLALWNTDYYFSLTRQTLVDRGVLSTLGYSRFEPGVKLRLLGGDPMDVCINWMDRAELLLDARAISEDGVLRRPENARTAA
jgi:hypothetical protein